VAERATTRQDNVEISRLLAEERTSAGDFAACRPLSLAEVKAKATYAISLPKLLRTRDHHGVLRSLL